MTDVLAFAKYQGTGNDFVMIIDLDDRRQLDAEVVAALCDRRRGIGADGLIRVIRASGPALFVMDYRNADGSDAEMCGNGARCVGRLVHDLGLTEERSFAIETRGGSRTLRLHEDDRVTVEMGIPAFTKAAIPMRGPAWETFLGQPIDVGGGLTLTASAVSMGNPHLVVFLDGDPQGVHVQHLGPALEHHDLFPEGTNVEFVRMSTDVIEARVWERGSGETLACGSGACAIAVAANEAGLAPTRSVVRFPGGEVEVERRDDGEVLLTGGAEHVFDGEIDLDRLLRRVRA